jgi:hypothetical protein
MKYELPKLERGGDIHYGTRCTARVDEIEGASGVKLTLVQKGVGVNYSLNVRDFEEARRVVRAIDNGYHYRKQDGKSFPPTDYPAIPDAFEGKFFDGWGYKEPADIIGWCWRTDYQTWGALVVFSDGSHVVTNPKRYPVCTEDAAA